MLRSGLRLWLYLGTLILAQLIPALLQFIAKLGALCCTDATASGYERIPEPGTGVPSPFGGRYPFVYTDRLNSGRDADGRKFLNSYLLLSTLDTGSSGKVKLAIDYHTKEYYVRASPPLTIPDFDQIVLLPPAKVIWPFFDSLSSFF